MPRSSTDDKNLLRPLGGVERLFWLTGQANATHFVLIAEVSGRTTVEQWRDALNLVLERTPLLAARIVETPDRPAHFVRSRHRVMPLRVFFEPRVDWETVASEELAAPFDAAVGPLGRAALLHGSERATLVLTLHHSAADGRSATYLLRDVLRAMAGEPAAPSSLPPTVESVIENAFGRPLPIAASATDAEPTTPMDAPPAAPEAGEAPRGVFSLAMSRSLTEALRERARAESSSVQGALTAALATVLKERRPDLAAGPVHVLSPIDMRHRFAGGREDLGLCVTAGMLAIEAEDDFWTTARVCREGLLAMQEPENLIAATASFSTLGRQAPTAAALMAMLAQAFAHPGSVTNLGAVDIPTRYGGGALTLDALWGPGVITFRERQTVGAVTLDGRLHLLHSSWAPVHGLLPDMLRLLERAVGQHARPASNAA